MPEACAALIFAASNANGVVNFDPFPEEAAGVSQVRYCWSQRKVYGYSYNAIDESLHQCSRGTTLFVQVLGASRSCTHKSVGSRMSRRKALRPNRSSIIHELDALEYVAVLL